MKSLLNKVIFSGIQPTGQLHLGNYLGAIRNWVNLQNMYHSNNRLIFCIVDHHALTDKFKIDHDATFEHSLHHDTLALTAALLASGISPDKATLFVQSHVPEHTELTWILSSIGPMSWLNKMTQYKDKKTKSSSLGLYSYPVLMAADILLYKANVVPVGDDQVQHVELTRDYAVRFNSLFCKPNEEFFPMPEYMKSEFPRVMSLRDGLKKMSKSDPSDFARINLVDDPETVMSKVRKAKTDSLSTIKHEESRPEVSNLLRIYSTLEGITLKEAEARFKTANMLSFKEAVAESIVKK
eukprot:TRINITY_DN3718_c0_g1_i6.p1 TRINITY_DN3718_c0_g1~~TRINITY_DN3718_c0_g1_i6.p1  ORF type:complete len:296 (-),score=53.97 TRINITY_DN3718_c0_g1_i6:254-1141(-)